MKSLLKPLAVKATLSGVMVVSDIKSMWDKGSGVRVIRKRFGGERISEGEEREVSTNPVRGRVES